MRKLMLALGLLLAGSATASAQEMRMPLNSDDVKWIPVPNVFPAGAQIAVISGDPSKPGPYVVRLELPDGAKFGPHFHGDVENVTVLQGTLLVGVGDTADPSKMISLPAGSFVSVPMGLHHYAQAKGDTIIQIHGMGPSSMTMVKM